MEEVLARQPGEVRAFLLRTAILGQASGDVDTTLTALYSVGLAQMARGRLRDADGTYRRALRLADDAALGHTRLASLAYGMISMQICYLDRNGAPSDAISLFALVQATGTAR